jgi:hypothetical protein
MSRERSSDEPELGAVIGSILQAVQEAKRLADLEAARLLEIYRGEKALSAFAVPAFNIADAEIELHFAIVGSIAGPKPGVPLGLKVSVAASALKSVDPAHLHMMKFKLTPVQIRAIEEETKI